MLRLFSSIRKTLINEGKTSRYARYAVGEFLLIVAGILVALQIQTWNENRKLEQERQELIESLKADFQTNLERLDDEIADAESVVENLAEFMRISAGASDDYSVGELQALSASAWSGVVFRPALSSYETALASGTLYHLKDSRLSSLFADFKDSLALFSKHQDQNLQMQFNGDVAGLRRRLGSLYVIYQTTESKPESYVLPDSEFRDLVKQKEVYSLFESKYELRRRQKTLLGRLKATTEQILAALEALD